MENRQLKHCILSSDEENITFSFGEDLEDILIINLKDIEQNNIVFNIKQNASIKISLRINASKKQLYFNIDENAKVNLNVVSLYDTFCSNLIFAKVHQNSSFDVSYADFINGQGKVEANIELLEHNATASWYLASSATENDKKSFIVNFNHIAEHTQSILNCNGVVRDNAHLHFLGDSHITRGAKKSSAKQKAKIIVFDEKCVAKANPILKIDENDIEASHAAALGKVSDEQLFYLCSRGIKEDVAKQMITYGYLRPIVARFFDKEAIKDIENIIEKRV